MDISEQKLCMICGMKKPITAFGNNNGKINTTCRRCLEQQGDDQGGGGLQINIIDKLAAITIEQEQAQQDTIENLEAITERLDEQTERSHNQDNRKNYSTSLFTDRRTSGSESFKTALQTRTAESTQSVNDQTSQHNKTKSHEQNKSAQTAANHFQNTLFSNSEQKQSHQSEQDTASLDHPDIDSNQKPYSRSTAKNNAAMTSRSLFGAKTHIPSAETLRVASGEKTVTTATTSEKTAESKQTATQKPVNETDAKATAFINTLLSRGPGRR